MERLNEIFNRAVPRRSPQQGNRTPSSLRQSAVRSGQLYGSQHQRSIVSSPFPRSPEHATTEELQPLAPGYHRHEVAFPSAPIPRSRQAPPLEQEDAPRRNQSFVQADNYLPAPSADVIDFWDTDDSALIYGDWEDDDENTMLFQRSQVPSSQQYASRSVNRYAETPHTPVQSRSTRDLRLPPTQSIPATRPGNSRIPPRLTQPLQSQLIPSSPPKSTLPAITRKMPAITLEKSSPLHLTSLPMPAAKQVCSRCKGAGYLRLDVPFGHPNFGKPIACTCKENERREKRRVQLRAMSNLDSFRQSSFRTFNARIPGVKEAFEVAMDYAQSPDGWLLLVGTNGCGKTHLAAAIANQRLESGSVVLFSVVPDLLDHLRAAFNPKKEKDDEVFDQLFSKMREAEVLVLDDLGSQQSSPWANEKLFQLLNYRYNMYMPTVITANPKGLQGIDERIRSRLSDIGLVTTLNFNQARDYRPHNPRR